MDCREHQCFQNTANKNQFMEETRTPKQVQQNNQKNQNQMLLRRLNFNLNLQNLNLLAPQVSEMKNLTDQKTASPSSGPRVRIQQDLVKHFLLQKINRLWKKDNQRKNYNLEDNKLIDIVLLIQKKRKLQHKDGVQRIILPPKKIKL